MPQNTLICGHRGARREAPENTLESFQLCIDMKADMIELDVRRSRDGILFIHHDALAGAMQLDLFDYHEIIAVFPLIPTLEQVCRMCTGHILIDIELKESSYEKEVISLVSGIMEPQEYFFSSFDDSIISVIKKISPTTETGLLLGSAHPNQFGQTHLGSMFYHKRLDKTRADWVLFHSWQLYGGVLARLRDREVKVAVWTENRDAWIRRLIRDERVNMICTDKPRRALELRKKITSQIKIE